MFDWKKWRVLLPCLILQFSVMSAYSENKIENCTHLNSIGWSDSLMYDKAILTGEENSEVKIRTPHPEICALYNFQCKEIVVDPKALVAIGNICKDWVFVGAVLENGYISSAVGWVEKGKLKFLEPTEEEKVEREKNRYERANKNNLIINAKYFSDLKAHKLEQYITSSSTDEKYEAIKYGVLRNDFDFIQKLIVSDGNLITHPKICKLLSKATGSDIKILQLLIESGVDVNCAQKHERTPLMAAASINSSTGRVLSWFRHGNSFNLKPDPISSAKLLIKKGSKINGDNDFSAVNSAISKNNIEMLSLLIKNGANVNNYVIKKWQKAPTSLMYAVKQFTLHEDPSAIDLLISGGADINYKSKFGYNHVCEKTTSGRCPYNGQTALTLAVQANSYSVAKLLLENGANPLLCRRTKRKDGCPLEISKLNNNKELEVLILKHID